jgi:transcriptional regulator with XRE-family HTH domain
MATEETPAKSSKSAGRPLGATGETVRKNIRDIRDNKGISGPELSARLGEMNRPIPPLGIHRIESGQRRVDVDDLVAIALALDISPITLIMPKTDATYDAVAITGVDRDVEARSLWNWLVAADPLTADTADAKLEFLLRALPVWELEKYTVTEHGLEPHVTTTIGKPPDDPIFKGALER